jgi:hypothetical protein
MPRFKDFSGSPDPVVFRIAPDDFECLPEIPLDAMAQMAELGGKLDDSGSAHVQLGRVYEFFDTIMTPTSAYLFRQRGRVSTPDDPNPNPVGMRAITEILPWLMEVYGLRPTQPSDDSSAGSTPDDTSSTVGA